MKPPVEHVRLSAKGREILIKVKRRTGLEHWNEICRVALCSSLANPNPPPKITSIGESSIDMEWKTFAGTFQEELAALTIIKAQADGIDIKDRTALAIYFRSHIERGLLLLQNIRNIYDIYHIT